MIPEDIMKTAREAVSQALGGNKSLDEFAKPIARAILAERERAVSALAEMAAERDLLQDIIDGRPAINAGLPESYVRWSQSIYNGDAARAAIRNA